MARYVDGFVIPVPKKKLKEYLKFAKMAAKIWIDHGALEYIECVADDVKKGKVTSFPQSVKLKSNETVVFSWAIYKSRAHRDRVLAKAMKDPRMPSDDPSAWPFDGMRVIFGGFKTIVSVKSGKKKSA